MADELCETIEEEIYRMSFDLSWDEKLQLQDLVKEMLKD